MHKNYLVVLFTVFTLSVFTLVIIELTGVTRNSLFSLLKGHKRDENGNEEYNGNFYSKEGEVYHGEIYPEETITRTQRVARMPKTTIHLYEDKYNFGNVSFGSVLKHTFRFKNTGQNPLMIAKTDVQCGCTVANFPDETIAAGKNGEITVEFNTTMYSGSGADRSPVTGHEEKTISIHSNAIPDNVKISVEADVLPPK
jgi:hypothetical protein